MRNILSTPASRRRCAAVLATSAAFAGLALAPQASAAHLPAVIGDSLNDRAVFTGVAAGSYDVVFRLYRITSGDFDTGVCKGTGTVGVTGAAVNSASTAPSVLGDNLVYITAQTVALTTGTNVVLSNAATVFDSDGSNNGLFTVGAAGDYQWIATLYPAGGASSADRIITTSGWCGDDTEQVRVPAGPGNVVTRPGNLDAPAQRAEGLGVQAQPRTAPAAQAAQAGR